MRCGTTKSACTMLHHLWQIEISQNGLKEASRTRRQGVVCQTPERSHRFSLPRILPAWSLRSGRLDRELLLSLLLNCLSCHAHVHVAASQLKVRAQLTQRSQSMIAPSCFAFQPREKRNLGMSIVKYAIH